MANRVNDRQAGYRRELHTYVTGLVLALLLTAIPFALVAFKPLPTAWVLGIVFALALAQVIVHFRCFLHITLSRSSRDDLNLLLFTALIVLLMVGGTLVILSNLHHRMM